MFKTKRTTNKNERNTLKETKKIQKIKNGKSTTTEFH